MQFDLRLNAHWGTLWNECVKGLWCTKNMQQIPKWLLVRCPLLELRMLLWLDNDVCLLACLPQKMWQKPNGIIVVMFALYCKCYICLLTAKSLDDFVCFSCRSLLVHLENGYFGRGFDQFCPQLYHYKTYVDNIHNASKVLKVWQLTQ